MKYRNPRFRSTQVVRVGADRDSYSIGLVKNVSIGGALIESADFPKDATRVLLEIGHERFEARLKRLDGDLAAVEFVRPLTRNELAKFKGVSNGSGHVGLHHFQGAGHHGFREM